MNYRKFTCRRLQGRISDFKSVDIFRNDCMPFFLISNSRECHIYKTDIISMPYINSISRQHYTKHPILRIGILNLRNFHHRIRYFSTTFQFKVHIADLNIIDTQAGNTGNGARYIADRACSDILYQNILQIRILRNFTFAQTNKYRGLYILHRQIGYDDIFHKSTVNDFKSHTCNTGNRISNPGDTFLPETKQRLTTFMKNTI